MKRHKLPPDSRLDWRDSNMPVFVRVLDPRDNSVKIIPVPPEKVSAFYAAKLRDPYYTAPQYKNDPSYWWGKNNLKKLK